MAELKSVQSIPSGVLELLGMKGSGQNPKTFEDALRGVIDVRQLYALPRMATAFDGFNAGAIGTKATLTVPANEHWLLLQVQGLVRVDGAATVLIAGSIEIDFGIVAQLDVTREELKLGDGAVLADNTVLQVPWFPPYPVMLRGGSRISCSLDHAIGDGVGDVAVQAAFAILQ